MRQKIISKFSIIAAIVLIFPTFEYANAQQTSRDNQPVYYLGLGLTTLSLLGDDLAKNPLAPVAPTTGDEFAQYAGASFVGQQSGIALRFVWSPSSDRTVRVPFGMDLHFYSGRDRVIISSSTRMFLRNDLTVVTAVSGLEYTLLQLPLARAHCYGAIDLRGTYVPGSSYTAQIEYDLFPQFSRTEIRVQKSDAIRFGGALRIGVDGQIDTDGNADSPWYVNISTGLAWMNLIGRDNARGELLTPQPNPITEIQENVTSNFFINILLQYQL